MKLLAHAGSRRQVLKTAAAATAALWVRPYPLYAQHEGDHLVRLIRDGAATAEIVVQRLRGNIAVLTHGPFRSRLRVRAVEPKT